MKKKREQPGKKEINSVYWDFKLRLQVHRCMAASGQRAESPTDPDLKAHPQGGGLGERRGAWPGASVRPARPAPRSLSPQGSGTLWALGRPRVQAASSAHLGTSACSMDAEPDPGIGTVCAAAPTVGGGNPATLLPIGCFRHCVPPLPDKATNTSHLSFSLIGCVKGRVHDIELAGAN